VLRLYTRAAGACTKEVALARLLAASLPVPRILGHGSGVVTGETLPFALLEFANGRTLSPLSDVGNLLRSRPDCSLPPEFADALRDGIEQEGASLPPDWRARAEYLDLTSACEFLSSEEERPRVHAQARSQIEGTLARWSG
jgi:hypothetical protein